MLQTITGKKEIPWLAEHMAHIDKVIEMYAKERKGRKLDENKIYNMLMKSEEGRKRLNLALNEAYSLHYPDLRNHFICKQMHQT